jgi:hypothetical protein
MKSLLLAALAATASGLIPLAAQTTNEGPAPDGGPGPAPDGGPGYGGSGGGGAGQGEMRERVIGFLPAAERERVRVAYTKAIAAHPKLQAESRELMKEMSGIEGADKTPGQRQAFLEKWRSHREKMRQAMLAEDPTIGPILDKIDKHMSALRAERERDGTAAPAP